MMTPEPESDGFYELRNALKNAENPDSQHRKPHGTEQESDGQKNHSVLWGICHQNCRSKKCNDATDDSEGESRAGDNSHADKRKQINEQDNREGQYFENPFHGQYLLCVFIIRLLGLQRKDMAVASQLR